MEIFVAVAAIEFNLDLKVRASLSVSAKLKYLRLPLIQLNQFIRM